MKNTDSAQFATPFTLRHKARDREHLLELLASLKAIVLYAVKSR